MRSGFDSVISLMMTWDVVTNDAKEIMATNFATQIVSTDEWILTSPCTKAMHDIVNISAGFRPIESSKDPKAGEIIISVNAAQAAIIDSVDVARSDPISAIRAGAGEKATRVVDKRDRNEDDCKTAKVLPCENSDVDAIVERVGSVCGVVDSVFSKLSTSFKIAFAFVSARSIAFFLCIVDPPLRHKENSLELFPSCDRLIELKVPLLGSNIRERKLVLRRFCSLELCDFAHSLACHPW
mmetsp:Transcript_15899/g.36810  ORF Transcript_15899/g.36810 Transcript_15899/m.36810 type:complete len:239 (-) Transcript_15899:133-849(-)